MLKKVKKKHIVITSILFGIISLFMFGTIAYSAINSTAKITGDAYARVETDVRITDFRLASTNNATSSFEEFGKSHIVTEINIVNSSSSISYYIEITNYGSSDIGIFAITGIPSGVNYSINNYNLKEKICDDSGKCNSFIKQTYEIVFTTTSTYSGNVSLNFEFRPFYDISYVGLTGNYVSDFIGGDEVKIDISADNLAFAYALGEDDFDFTYSSKIISFSNVFCDVEIGAIKTKEFDYVGNYQTYKVKANGIYKIELWGAQGGNNGGYGSYTSGYIALNRNDELYFYVGGEGVSNIEEDYTGFYNTFNCGGYITGQAGQKRVWGTGGGSTDVRLVSGNWDNFDSLKSRIMVAAGGGGSYNSPAFFSGGSAGGLVGYNGEPTSNFSSSNWGSPGYGASQTGPGYNVINNSSDPFYKQGYTSVTYGFGGFGKCGSGNVTELAAGGGSGYYGGGSSTHIQSAGGGSSFISWHDGCDAIASNSTSSNIIHTGKSLHYSDYAFGDTRMIDGNGYSWTTDKTSNTGMPSYTALGTVSGNTGNGYAKITPIELGNGYVVKFTNITSHGYDCCGTISGLVVGVAWHLEPSLYPNVKVYTSEGVEHSNYTYNSSTGSLTVFKPFKNIEIRAEN